MKTFRQWFDNLSQETQEYLKGECKWIDVNSKDRYHHVKDMQELIDATEVYCKERLFNDNYIDGDSLNKALMAIMYQHKNEMKTEQYYTFLVALFDKDRDLAENIDALDLREVFKRRAEFKNIAYKNDRWSSKEKTYKYPLNKLLLVIEDFTNPDWSLLDTDNVPLNNATCEILGDDQLVKMAKDNPDRIRLHRSYRSGAEDNTVFDRLFFCEDGWTKKQKERIINDYDLSLEGVEDFMRRIVAVDGSYLRYIGTYFINHNPALGMYLYKQKKPEDELNALPAGHKVEEEYRYPKAYRKLFQIAACCARENVGKAMAGTIGESAAILKMYGYDFNKIFDCLYPEYAELPEAETAEAATV